MISFKVTPENLPRLFRERHLERYKRVVKAIQDTVEEHGQRIAVQNTQALGRYAPINTHAYLEAWQTRKTETGAVVFNDSPYASIIEKGRRRGARMPPVKVIAEWLDQKLRGRIRNRAKRLKQVRGIAFVVARAIGRRGLPAKHIMRKTKRKLDDMVRAAVRRALEQR